MGRGAFFISILASTMIVGILAKKRVETAPSAVMKALPLEAGDEAPKDLQAVPAHVEKMMKRKMENYGKKVESESADE